MKHFKGVFIIVLFLLNYFSIYTQQVYRANSIKVFHGSKELKNPFTGGFNASLVNRMDLNQDGFLDLVIINNFCSKISTFINTKTIGFNSYKYEPKYESFFPKELEAPFLMRDINRDSISDIVMHNIDGTFSVYYGFKNTPTSFTFKMKYPQLKGYSEIYSNYSGLRKYPYFLPIIEDLDADGDIDFINNNSSNNSVYFKNLGLELNLPKDSLYIVDKNIYFGQFAFSANPLAFVSNHYPNIVQGMGANIKGLKPRHNEYQSIWAMDANNDGLMDVLGTNEFDHNSPLGMNKGTKDSAFIYNYDTFFPSYNQPINKWQPYGIWSDYDNDGKKDLLITSLMNRDDNSEKTLKVYNPDIHIFQMYKNQGKKLFDSLPIHNDSFTRTVDTFLTHEHIDIGTLSAPIFFDYNNDTLLDILVPNGFSRDSQDIASISLYQNIGSKYIPKFTLITNDYLNYKAKNRLNIKIAVGDLNGDNLSDLFVTSYNVNPGLKIYLAGPSDYINYEILYQVKGTDNKATFPTLDTFSLNNNYKFGNANPCLYDLNEDGKLDLLVGEIYKMRYHKNLGTNLKPDFRTITNDTLIDWSDIDTLNYRERHFYPAVSKDTLNGKPYLYFGYQYSTNSDNSQVGKIGKAVINKDSISTKRCQIINKDVIGSWLGARTTLAIADINKDSLPDFIIGNYAGGIQIYSYGDIDSSKEIIPPPDTTHGSIIQTNSNFTVFPNPVSTELTIEHSILSKIFISIYSVDGKIVHTQELKSKKIDISHLNSGLYLLHINTENEVLKVIKVLKE